jgi:hypothetical protein
MSYLPTFFPRFVWAYCAVLLSFLVKQLIVLSSYCGCDNTTLSCFGCSALSGFTFLYTIGIYCVFISVLALLRGKSCCCELFLDLGFGLKKFLDSKSWAREEFWLDYLDANLFILGVFEFCIEEQLVFPTAEPFLVPAFLFWGMTYLAWSSWLEWDALSTLKTP